MSRWLYGIKPPLIIYDQVYTKEFIPPTPLPITRKRRLSITSNTSPKAATRLSMFLGRCIGEHDHAASQDQCLLFTKLPLELRLLVYGHVLGNRTVHIIPSHVPSLTPPPRYSFKTHPFRRRLDFEECSFSLGHRRDNKTDVESDPEDPEHCTHENLRNWELNRLFKVFRWHQRLKLHLDSDAALEYFVKKWGRKGGPLALLKTCRVMYVSLHPLPTASSNVRGININMNSYSEAIPVLYTTTTFSFADPFELQVWPTTLLPSRIALLRHIVVHFNVYSTPTDQLTFTQSCAFLQKLPALETLHVTLSAPAQVARPSTQESVLTYLVGIQVKREFVVYVDWAESECEKHMGDAFRLVRQENLYDRNNLGDGIYMATMSSMYEEFIIGDYVPVDVELGISINADVDFAFQEEQRRERSTRS